MATLDMGASYQGATMTDEENLSDWHGNEDENLREIWATGSKENCHIRNHWFFDKYHCVAYVSFARDQRVQFGTMGWGPSLVNEYLLIQTSSDEIRSAEVGI